MNLTDARSLALELMGQHLTMVDAWEGFFVDEGWSFEWMQQKRTLGDCSHGKRRIRLSTACTECNDEATVRNTILHEIAHALVGPGHGHDFVWKAQARALGVRPESCSRSCVAPLGKWVAVCPRCSYEHNAYRKPHVSKLCAKDACQYAAADTRRLTYTERRKS